MQLAWSQGLDPGEDNALDWRVRQCVPIPANIQQFRTAIEEEWTDIPHATINSMQKRCVALHETNGDTAFCDP